MELYSGLELHKLNLCRKKVHRNCQNGGHNYRYYIATGYRYCIWIVLTELVYV